ncbi:glycine oxidase ThiO [Paenibacillus nanensis]|uniref:glycine oxidase n=1 Tax=Paenibacillus nanensis TaxID=393251 RepID=A0A3A1UXK3_9BACL|nr:glycine oxidase ThiO [Paenibacillus nanensis]RIX52436.1 glycine oxidase ThiO [Paenibacillus nanensis]
MPQNVLILGGGIIGLSCAFEAARRGYRVRLVEPGRLGGQASGAAAGMLAPYSENTEQPDEFFQLCLRSLRLFPEWIRDVEEASGLKADWVQSGSLNVFRHEADLLPAESRMRWHNAWGAKEELVTGAALRGLEPRLSSDAAFAVYSPEESHVYAPGLVAALETACGKMGIDLIDHAGEMLSMEIHSGGGASVFMANLPGALRADRLVICSGAWTGQFERWLGIAIPIHPIRGQICSYEGQLEELRHMVFSSQAYWVGKRIGRIVCGASEDVAGFDTSVTERGIERLLRASKQWFPMLAERETAHRWAGLRPATADGLPLIGPVRGNPAILMAAGHYRNGVLLSPATAKLTADMLDGLTGGQSASVFSPERFTLVPR